MTLSPASHQLPVIPLPQRETIIDLPSVQTTDLPAVRTTGAREACQPHWTQHPMSATHSWAAISSRLGWLLLVVVMVILYGHRYS